MKNVVRCMTLLMVIGLTAAPLYAAEFRATGFFDNVFPHFDHNVSGQNGDNDTTRTHDNETLGRTRFRGFFNFIASDDLRGVLALEIDQVYGAPASNAVGSGC